MGLWDALVAASGSLALTFIVALVLGISATAVLFFGSAVVVLERFARGARRWGVALAVTLAFAALLGALGLDEQSVEALGIPWPGAARAWLGGSAVAFVLLALAQAITVLLLRFVSGRALAMASVVGLGAGYALLVGGLDQLGYALAPAAVTAAAALALRWRRRRRGMPHVGFDERLATTLAGVLSLGAVLPLVLPAPDVRVGSGGGSLLTLFVLLVLLGLLPRAAAGLIEARGSAEWFIARRYLFAKRRQTFISVITGICVAGVAAGVWLIITVLSVMNGFERVWREEIIGNRAHLTIHAMGPIEDYRGLLDQVMRVPDVEGASPYLDAQGMVRGPGGSIMGVRVRGIDPERVGTVTDLRADLLPGSEHALENLAPLSRNSAAADGPNGKDAARAAGGDGGGAGIVNPRSEPQASEDAAGDPGIIIGSQLAAAAGVGVGDPLVLISPFGGPPTPLGPGPRLKRFRVAGVFQSSFFQYDEAFTFVNMAAAQDFRRSGDVADGIEVRTSDYYRSQRVAAHIEEAIGFPYFTRDWKEFFPSFFQALKTERVMMFVLLTMIMVVAAFAIVVTLIMMIMEKSADIAILKAMGATDAAIERIFAIEGTLIGLLGTLLGVISGIAVTTQLGWVQGQIETITGIDTLPASIYQFSQLPWEIDVAQIGIVVAIAMVLALGATLLPSRHGARLDPAEALRYE
jgi:lipoprotein-releasing system permease protein